MLDLSAAHLEYILDTLEKYVPECEVLAFGSRIKGTAKPYSDLDLALVGDQPIDRSRLNRLEEAFEASDLPIQVDLLDWHRIDSNFQNTINADYQVIKQKTQ